MFQPVTQESTEHHILWQHKWSDGSRLELSETSDNFVLIEYDSDNNPIPYMVETGHIQAVKAVKNIAISLFLIIITVPAARPATRIQI